MNRIVAVAVAFIIAISSVISVCAADGKVTYKGNAEKFVFEQGSKYSPTDLFSNFKDVMPGDSITQKITVKNDASNKVKVKIYLRSLGAHEDSVEFLSQLGLTVKKSEDNKNGYMFDALASETSQLTDWVCLGTLYSGGKVDLDVTLNVPEDLENMFQNNIGYLDWEFMAEELPIEADDPKLPQTGDNSNINLWFLVLISSACGFIILIVLKTRRNTEEQK